MNRCVFCEIAAKQVDGDLTVYEDEYVFAQVSIHQKLGNHGHVLVIPKRHIENIYELDNDLNAPLMRAIRLLSVAVKETFSAEGIMVRQNNERAAGQDVFHLHFHVVPRYKKDGFERKQYFELPLDERHKIAEQLKAVLSNLE